MKKPMANCQHARFEIEHKWFYSQEEYDACEGLCWKCGGPLVLSELERGPEYVCKPCEKNRLEAFENFDHSKSRDVKDILEEMRGKKGREKYKRDTMERIAEVEACVPDCPYRDRLDAWKKNLETADKKIEGFDHD